MSAAPGWYPLPTDPGTERYWNGTAWTEHHRPRPVTPAPPSGGGGNMVVRIIVLGVVLLFGGCIASTVLVVDSTVDTFETLTATTLQDDGEPGSITSPHAFGTAHTRPPGLSGSGWTVTVDEIRDLGDGCLAVVGSATLDTLEGERELSFRSSFPEIELVAIDERVAEPDDCGRSSSALEGRLWAQDTEVSAGSSFSWFETFDVSIEDVHWVSVSGTLYWS